MKKEDFDGVPFLESGLDGMSQAVDSPLSNRQLRDRTGRPDQKEGQGIADNMLERWGTPGVGPSGLHPAGESTNWFFLPSTQLS